jgi:hypothetical protein
LSVGNAVAVVIVVAGVTFAVAIRVELGRARDRGTVVVWVAEAVAVAITLRAEAADREVAAVSRVSRIRIARACLDGAVGFRHRLRVRVVRCRIHAAIHRTRLDGAR